MRENLLLAAAAVLAFLPAMTGPFYLDDFALLADRWVTGEQGWSEVLRLSRPLSWISFRLNYAVSSDSPPGYRVVNLLLHAAVVLLARRALGKVLPASAARFSALLFAVHPLATEPVAYVFARANLLMTLFCVLSLGDWLAGRSWRAVVWFAPALLAKEECVAFPIAVALLGPRVWRPLAAMMALSLAAGTRVLWLAAVTPGSGAGPQAGISPLDYGLTQGIAIWRYVQLAVVPIGFTIESPLMKPPVWLGIGAWIALAAGAVIAHRKARWALWLVAGLVLLLPSSSFLPAEDLSGDRRMYLPMVAFSAAAGLALASRRRTGYAIAAAFAVLSLHQSWIWADGSRLWRQAVNAAPAKVRPRIQLARYIGRAGAIEVLNDARRIAPEDPRVPAELGRVHLEANRPAEALQAFGDALALSPNDARALNNRAAALLALGQTEAARQDLERARKIEPCHPDVIANLNRLGIRPDIRGCR